MSLDDIRASAEAARNAIDAAKNLAVAAMQHAAELAQDAAGRGWEGVSHTVMAAQSELEAVVSSLGTGHDAAEGLVQASGEINTKLSPKDISQRLTGLAGQIGAANTSVETASGSLHGALNYSQQADADSLTSMIGSVFDSLGTARQSVEATGTVTQAEQQEAASWAKN